MKRIALDFTGMKIKYNTSEYKELIPEQLKVIKDYDMTQKSRGNRENTRDVHVRFLMRFARLVKKGAKKPGSKI